MNETETRELIYSEVRRYVSPKTYTILVALNIVLIIFNLVLYDQTRNQQAWIDVLSGDVKALKSVNYMSQEITKLGEVLETIVDNLDQGNKPEPEEK